VEERAICCELKKIEEAGYTNEQKSQKLPKEVIAKPIKSQ